MAPCEAVGEITTGGALSSHSSPVPVAAPATLRPPSSVQAMRIPSGDSEASLATPLVGRKQSTAAGNVGDWSMPWVATMAILPIVCVPPSHCSSSAAASPFAATSVRRRSSPLPEKFIQGVKSFPYGEADAFCTYTVPPLCAIIRLPNSVGCSPSTLIGSSELLLTGRTWVPCENMIGQQKPLFE